MGRDQELKWLAFSLYPFSFFLYSPYKEPFIDDSDDKQEQVRILI